MSVTCDNNLRCNASDSSVNKDIELGSGVLKLTFTKQRKLLLKI